MQLTSRVISSVFGIGYCPLAPGTAGSIFVLLIYWLSPEINNSVFLFIIILLFFIGVVSATATEKEFINRYGSKNGHDPQVIIIDEVVGMLITMFAVPKTIYFFIAGFILFRLFDIIKPFPIKISQKIPRGWGVMIDDVLAGIYANIIIQIFILIK